MSDFKLDSCLKQTTPVPTLDMSDYRELVPTHKRQFRVRKLDYGHQILIGRTKPACLFSAKLLEVEIGRGLK